MERVSADATGVDIAAPQAAEDEQLIRLDEALAKLGLHDPRKAELVKHHHFVGLTLEETAEVMGISERTAKRDWAYARAWLFNEIKGAKPGA